MYIFATFSKPFQKYRKCLWFPIWQALTCRLLDFTTFNVDEYEHYEVSVFVPVSVASMPAAYEYMYQLFNCSKFEMVT